MRSASTSRWRALKRRCSSMPARIFASVFAPNPGSSAIRPAPACLLERLHRVDAEHLPQDLRLLRPHAGKLDQGDEGTGDLLAELVEEGAAARLHHLGDVPRHVLSDAGEGGQVLVRLHHLPQRPVVGLDGAGGVPVGADPEGVAPLDLQEISDLAQGEGDADVVHAGRSGGGRGTAGRQPMHLPCAGRCARTLRGAPGTDALHPGHGGPCYGPEAMRGSIRTARSKPASCSGLTSSS
jgi:hypothetical protein